MSNAAVKENNIEHLFDLLEAFFCPTDSKNIHTILESKNEKPVEEKVVEPKEESTEKETLEVIKPEDVEVIEPGTEETLKPVEEKVVEESTEKETLEVIKPEDVEVIEPGTEETLKPVEDVITMQARKTCPVHITPVKKEKVKIKVGQVRDEKNNSVKNQAMEEEEDRLRHLIEHLRSINVNFTPPCRMPTGLYELQIIQANGNPVLISADINGLLYSEDIKFFLGHINPGDEYAKIAIMMTNSSIISIVKNEPIDPKYYVPEQLFTLNKFLDLQTLKETDKKKRAKAFEKAAKVLSDPDIYDGIIKAANGEPFRFSFARYSSPNDFSLVSSRRNLQSNLTDDKLLVSKEIWINLKRGKDMTLETKNCSK